VLKYAGQHHTGHAITSIHDYFERFEFADIDEREGMLDVIFDNISLRDLAFVSGFGEITCYGEITNIGQAGIQVGNACWELYCLEHGIQVRIRSSPALIHLL
jgi:hypothetical protein